MTPAQCRAARVLVDMTQAELAGAAVVPATLVADYETGVGSPRPSDLEAIQRARLNGRASSSPMATGLGEIAQMNNTWMECSTVFPGIVEHIQDDFELAFVGAGGPRRMALFARTSEDHRHKIFLLSPDAAKFVGDLRGLWTECAYPSAFEWSLLVGQADAHQLLGLRAPAKGRG